MMELTEKEKNKIEKNTLKAFKTIIDEIMMDDIKYIKLSLKRNVEDDQTHIKERYNEGLFDVKVSRLFLTFQTNTEDEKHPEGKILNDQGIYRAVHYGVVDSKKLMGLLRSLGIEIDENVKYADIDTGEDVFDVIDEHYSHKIMNIIDRKKAKEILGDHENLKEEIREKARGI